MEPPVQNMPLIFAALIVALCTTTADGQLIVAHRGASYDAPENTLAAFRLAWEQQADAIEGDFYVTKDQQIVCIHDKTTKRIAPQQPELSIAESTLAELQKLDVGSWKHPRYATERIPTLKDVLATIPEGKQIFVEIKCGPEILPLLQPQLEASSLKSEQIVIICFSQTVISQARQRMPQYHANWLTGYKQETKNSECKPTQAEVLETLKNSGATGLGTNGNLEIIDLAFVESIRHAGFQFHVWTVNDVDAAREFADLGAASITTDRPAFIRKAIQLQAAGSR
jgi:glycerophosphoryl diester phosphodiesterase